MRFGKAAIWTVKFTLIWGAFLIFALGIVGVPLINLALQWADAGISLWWLAAPFLIVPLTIAAPKIEAGWFWFRFRHAARRSHK